MKIININSNGLSGVIVTLKKPILASKITELGESTIVNLYTECNITFSKGFVVKR